MAAQMNMDGDGEMLDGAFTAFLSHRYRSPDVNLYFYGICSRTAEIQFEVDEGDSPISMARLSRMVRAADAFIGIYPLPAEPTTRVGRHDLETASQYFNVELNLAASARLPMLVYYDERYRSVLDFPEWAQLRSFSIREVTGRGGMPSEERHRRAFLDFYRAVSSRMRYRAESEQRQDHGQVGFLLPPDTYSEILQSKLEEVVSDIGYRSVRFEWPLRMGAGTVRGTAKCDWIFVDPGDSPEGAASLGWLEGQSVPIARLRAMINDASAVPHAEEALYGGFRVGYHEDRLVWQSDDVLLPAFRSLIDRILAPVTRINTIEEAKEYFRGANRRPESVFLSYASENSSIADRLSNKLKEKFNVVFDYRDGESLSAGDGYPQQLYDNLAASDIGIPILSSEYVSKRTCTHEAQDMCASYDSGDMFVFPLNVDAVKPPTYFRSVQFEPLRADTFDEELIVDRIVKGYVSWSAERRH